MNLKLYETPQEAAPHVYINSLKNSSNSVAMIHCFLSGKTIQQTSNYLDIAYPTVAQARYRFSELVSIYLKQGSIYLPEYY